MSGMNSLVFECPFMDDFQQRITCDLRTCAAGSYTEVVHESSTMMAVRSVGACATCNFSGDIIDVFNTESTRFIPEAPECYKSMAAKVLTQTDVGRGMLGRLKAVAPKTVEIIENYIKD